MSRQILAAAGLMLAICPAAAAAQDTNSGESPSPLSTGFRVEALIGYDHASFDSVFDGDGLLYGVGVGYDLALGRMRLGVEAELTDSTADTCFGLVGFPGESCLRGSRDFSIGTRIGFEIDRGVLVYGKVAYSSFRESNSFPAAIVTPGAPGQLTLHPYIDGLRLGVGSEFALSRRTFVKVEYRFTNYEFSSGFNRHQAVMGFGFRF